MEKNKISYLFINLFSTIKRFFLDPIIYSYITFIPLFFILSRFFSKSGIVLTIFLSIILILNGNYYVLYYLSPFFILIIFHNNFKKINLFKIVNSTKWFLIIVIFYAFLQITFNFFQFEVDWINSDLSIVNSENVFIPNRTIKPFSVFSDTTTFTFFCSIYLIVFLRNKKYIWTLISLIGFIISGTRGFILAFILAYLIVYVFKIKSKIKIFISSIAITSFIYSFLIYFSNFFIELFIGTSSRYLLYGTLYGRYLTIIKKLEDFELINIIVPMKFDYLVDSDLVFDNLHLTLLANFGIIGYILFWKFFKIKKDDDLSIFFLTYLIICGFFADIIFSFYLFFLVLIAFLSTKKYE